MTYFWGLQCSIQIGQTFSLCPSAFISNPYSISQIVNATFTINGTDENINKALLPLLNVFFLLVKINLFKKDF